MDDRQTGFFAELSRRKVFRVVAIYTAVAWGVVEFVQAVAPQLGLPPITNSITIGLFILGFPLAVVLVEHDLQLVP